MLEQGGSNPHSTLNFNNRFPSINVNCNLEVTEFVPSPDHHYADVGDHYAEVGNRNAEISNINAEISR